MYMHMYIYGSLRHHSDILRSFVLAFIKRFSVREVPNRKKQYEM